MHPSNIELDRVVMISYSDEVDRTVVEQYIPHCITFGRGAWWLEATDVKTAAYTRIRMSRITLFQKAS